jgi:hypothetical protein
MHIHDNKIVPNWNNQQDITDLVMAESSVTESVPEINNLGGNYDPFVEIHKQPTYLSNGNQTGAYAITLGDNQKEVGIVKENYLLIENQKISEIGHTFWHTKNNVNWANEISRATQVLRNQSGSRLQSFAEACGRLQKPIELQDVANIRENYLSKLPTQQFGQMIDKYLIDKDYSAWGLLNAGTNVLWHSNKLTTANFNNNSLVVDGMLEYGKTLTPDTTDPNQLSFA